MSFIERNVINLDIETKGLGAGSYPEPPEPKEKCYVITCSCSAKGEFVVYAKDYEEAKEMLKNSEYEEFELREFQIEDINGYEIDG